MGRRRGRGRAHLFEATGFGALQDELRRVGFNVIGGSATVIALETDRAFARACLLRVDSRSRPRLNTQPLRRRFVTWIPTASLRLQKERFGRRHVRRDPCRWSDVARCSCAATCSGDRFILMDHVEGVEIAAAPISTASSSFGPPVSMVAQTLFRGDMGELTGEMGTVATFEGSKRVQRDSIAHVEPHLREAGQVDM